MARDRNPRRPVPRHRVFWALAPIGVVLIVTDCRWRSYVMPVENETECLECLQPLPVPEFPVADWGFVA